MDFVADALTCISSNVASDESGIIYTGHDNPASALASATEYLFRCLFEAAKRGSLLSAQLHQIWGSALGHYYITQHSILAYNTSAAFLTQACNQALFFVQTHPDQIANATKAATLLMEGVDSLAGIYCPHSHSRASMEALIETLESCT